MRLLEFFFWFALFIVFYSYIGYGILVWVILRARRLFSRGRSFDQSAPLIPVTVVVAAYNEEDFIEQKIHNTLAIDYPRELLSIIFITDGSSDSTYEKASRFKEIQVLHHPERRGKIVAIHRAMNHVKTPVVVFSDANTLLNPACIRNIVRHYQDQKTGGVAGEKKVIATENSSVEGTGEGLYWKYESFLKKLDSDLYTVVGAAGELFSIRTELYRPVETNVLLDDFIISLRICQQGYRIAYEPGAFASEAPSASLAEEQKRKVRISAGAFQSIVMLKELLNVFKTPLLSFQYISHRVLRWTLCPIFLPLILISNMVLVAMSAGTIYTVILIAQLLFYASALAGWLLSRRGIRVKLLHVPYYFIFQNTSLYTGFVKYLGGRQSVLWEKAARGS